jgi:glycosyltransferase involved in cell wall biosynthesis
MGPEPPALILDVTRLVARAGRPVLTGIDRIERAYLIEILRRDPGARLVVGTRAGQLLLPAAAGRILSGWIDDPAKAPLAGRSGRRIGRAAALAALWPRRAAFCLTPRAFARALAPGGWFLSVGHLNPAGLGAAGRVPGLFRAVMVHDTIPLDLAEVAAARRLRPLLAQAVAADLTLFPSAAAAADLARHAGPPRAPLVVPPGVELAPRGPLPPCLAAIPAAAPVFLALGTLTPRKDPDFLLDLWQGLAADPPPGPVPHLVLAGRVGAGGGAVAARAARMAAAGLPVHHCADLGDGAVAALMARARALLQPSRAEGFGLPAAEAAACGVPVLCLPLPATREVLGDYPVYLPPGAAYPWDAAIRALCAAPAARVPRVPPDWGEHFDRVFARIGAGG